MTQRRVETTRVHYWTFSPVTVNDQNMLLMKIVIYVLQKNLNNERRFQKVTNLEISLLRNNLLV